MILQQHDDGNDRYWGPAFGKRPAEELFDIVDPECIVNLAENPSWQDLKESLWQELRQKLVETGDPRMEDRGDIFDSYEYTGMAKHSWANYLAGLENIKR